MKENNGNSVAKILVAVAGVIGVIIAGIYFIGKKISGDNYTIIHLDKKNDETIDNDFEEL